MKMNTVSLSMPWRGWRLERVRAVVERTSDRERITSVDSSSDIRIDCPD